jgi:hypothetical protein
MLQIGWVANEWGIKNSPKVVEDGSLVFTSHAISPRKPRRSSPLRTLTKFTNSPIYQEIYKLVADFSWLPLVERETFVVFGRKT